jgi:hypothetical protein
MNPHAQILIAVLQFLLVWSFGGCFLIVALLPVAERIGYGLLLLLSGPAVWFAFFMCCAVAAYENPANSTGNAPRV